MVVPIPKHVKKIWEKWNVRGVILLSLCLQMTLIFGAPLRKRTQRSLVVWCLWSAYLLADWAANFCVGLIASNQDHDGTSSSTITTNSYLLAFWAPFLLLHLGGPDTITAFAIEDNELWLRHLLGFIIQVTTALYVFLLTVPGNTLCVPTVLVFGAGMIKYGERTCALYLASMDTFRQSMIGEPNAGSDYPRVMEKYISRKDAGLPTQLVPIPESYKIDTAASDDVKKASNQLSDDQVVPEAYRFFNKFKGIIVDLIYSFHDRNESRQYFHSITAEDALKVIEVELNFFYEAFYTKYLVVRHKLGYPCRFVAVSFIVAALGLFFSVDKEKQGFDPFDVKVTYALLCGAAALDVLAFFMLIFSDRTLVSSRRPPAFIQSFIMFKRLRWSSCTELPYIKYTRLSRQLLFRRWNGSIAGYNLINHCLHQCSKKKSSNYAVVKFIQPIKLVMIKLLATRLYKVKNPFLKEFWEFTFLELKRKSAAAEDVETIHRICSARGELVLQEGDVLDREHMNVLMPFVSTNEVAFDESLILWHTATHICYTVDQEDCHERHFSKILSDYMLYLLVLQSTMISAVAGIGTQRFQDTCAEAIKFFKERGVETVDKDMEACERLLKVPTDHRSIDIKGDSSKSLLFDACRLAKDLRRLDPEQKWKIICKVWVELLSFAASNCRPIAHLQQLSKGGELLSLVWLLMIHLGLGKQFQVRDAKVKLVAGK